MCVRKQITSCLFENTSNLEESAEPKLLDYSVDSDNDTHPRIYCKEPFKESCAKESWIQCTELSCLKWALCLCAGVNSHTTSLVCQLCLLVVSVCNGLVYVFILRNYNYIRSSLLRIYFFSAHT